MRGSRWGWEGGCRMVHAIKVLLRDAERVRKELRTPFGRKSALAVPDSDFRKPPKA